MLHTDVNRWCVYVLMVIYIHCYMLHTDVNRCYV
jgi:hypothetical protein